jgi:superfamily II DNA/RNA helicase
MHITKMMLSDDLERVKIVSPFRNRDTFSWFIHRSGRTARCGREGNALLFLTPSEEGYLEFLQRNQGVTLDALAVPYEEGQEWEQLERIRKMAASSR